MQHHTGGYLLHDFTCKGHNGIKLDINSGTEHTCGFCLFGLVGVRKAVTDEFNDELIFLPFVYFY